MREEQVGGLRTRVIGGTDDKGGGNGPVVESSLYGLVATLQYWYLR
jgi:hypothetical protein